MPTSNGLPRRVATHSPGKCTLLKHRENAPSCKVQSQQPHTHRVRDLIHYQLLNHLLDELSERVRRVLRVDVLDQLGNHFCVRLRLEFVALIFQELFNVLVVGDDA